MRRSSRRASPWVTIFAALAMFTGGCFGGDDAAATHQIVADEMRFSPSRLTIETGPAVVVVKNTGAVVHTFSLNDTGDEVKVNSGDERRLRITARRGTYKFVCRILDHEGLGMTGTLVVR